MDRLKKIWKFHPMYIIIPLFVILSAINVIPYFHGLAISGGYDFSFHMTRTNEIYLNMKNGDFLHLIPDINTQTFGRYGYPVNIFYPIYMMIPEAFIHYLIGNSYVAYLIFLILINFLIMLSMYFASNRVFKYKTVAIMSSILYVFSQYKLVDMFSRRAIPETITFIFIPIVFLGIYEIFKGNPKKWYILSFGMALIGLNHVVSLILSSVFILSLFGILFIFNEKKEIIQRLWCLLKACILTLLLDLFFLYPLLDNIRFSGGVLIGVGPLYDGSLSIETLIFNFLPYGNGATHEMTGAGIGIVGIFIIISSIIFYNKLNKIEKYLFFDCLFFILISSNLFPWQLLQNEFKMIQFTYRFLIIVTFLFSLIGGKIITMIFKNKILGIYLVIILEILISTAFVVYIKQNPSINLYQKTSFSDFDKYTITSNKFKPQNFDYIPLSSFEIKDKLPDNNIKDFNNEKNVSQINFGTSFNKIHYDIKSLKKQDIIIPNIYYKGMNLYVNSEKQHVKVLNNKLIIVNVKKGINQIDIKFEKNKIQKSFDLISLFSWISLLIYLFTLLFKKYRSKLG